MEYGFVVCNSCGKQNRVAKEKIALGLQPKCGECGNPLQLQETSGPSIATDNNFSTLVEQAGEPVLVDFWAPWCAPCHALAPVIDQLASEFKGKVKVAKLNTDENPSVSYRFQVRSIPTLIIFNEGREVDRLVGVRPKAEIAAKLQKQL